MAVNAQMQWYKWLTTCTGALPQSKDACSQPHKATMQGRIMTATQSHCTMQRHKWLSMHRCNGTNGCQCTDATAQTADFAEMQNQQSKQHSTFPFLSMTEIFRLSVISFLCCLSYCNNHNFMVKLCTESFTAVNEIKALHYCKYQTNIRKESI